MKEQGWDESRAGGCGMSTEGREKVEDLSLDVVLSQEHPVLELQFAGVLSSQRAQWAASAPNVVGQ